MQNGKHVPPSPPSRGTGPRVLWLLMPVALAFLALVVNHPGGVALSANPWGALVKINGSGAAQDTIGLAIDSTGKEVTVWKDSPTGVYFQTFYAIRPAGGSWSNGANLTGNGNGTRNVDIGGGPNDTMDAVWEENVGGTWHIAVANYTGSAWGNRSYVNTGSSNDFHPAAAVDSAGVIHVVFTRAQTSIRDATSTTAAPGSWTESVVSTGSNLGYPRIAIDHSTNIMHVIWVDLTPPRPIWYSSKPISGGAWSAPVNLGYGLQPDVAARNGKVVATWTDEAGGIAEHIVQRTLSGGSWGSKVTISAFDSGYRPHVELDSVGNPHVIWMQFISGSNYDIYFSDFSGSAWSAPQPIASTGGLSEANALVVDTQDNLHATLTDQTNGRYAYSSDRGSLPPPPPPSVGCTTTTYEDNNAGLTYAGTWTVGADPSATNGTYRYSNDRATPASVSFSFVGGKLVYTYIGYTNRGIVQVLVDGVSRGTVDQYTSSLQYNLTRTFDNLGPSPHTGQIRHTGTKNASSSNYYVTVDALSVTKCPVQLFPLIFFESGD